MREFRWKCGGRKCDFFIGDKRKNDMLAEMARIPAKERLTQFGGIERPKKKINKDVWDL